MITNRGTDLNLQQIRLPEISKGSLSQEYIYLLEASAIEEHVGLLHDVDLISLGYLDPNIVKSNNLSVIMLPEDYQKNTIFNKVQDIFAKYAQWDYGLLRSIAAHESLQNISDQAASVLVNPFALLDVTLKRILKAGKLPENYKGSIWEMVMEQGYTPAETFSLSADELYFFLRHNKEPYFPIGSPYTQYSDLMANIYLDGKHLAFIAATSINGPFTQGQVSLFRHVRDRMELAIVSSTELKGSSEVVTYYLEKLLKGFPVDDKIINYHLRERGWRINDNFRIYTIANASGKELDESQAEFCLFRINKLQKDVISFTYEGYIILITRPTDEEQNKAYQEKLKDLLAKLGLHCGCSQTFNRFNDLKYYFIQSKAALFEGEKHNPEKNLWNFSDFYFQHLLSSLDNSTSLKSLCHPGVLRLKEHDNKYGTDFVRCLQIYIFHGCNIAQTAKDLFMHRNTLKYRLGKIAEIINMNVQELSENERMQLWFSCLISGIL